MTKILFAVSSWGLGHATRSLPLIRRLLAEGCEVTIISTGRALSLLGQELGERCAYIDLPDAPTPLGSNSFSFYGKFTLSIPSLIKTILLEHQVLRDLLRNDRYDKIITDYRYGVFSRKVDSYYLTHGLRHIAPGRIPSFELALELFNWFWFRFAKRVIIPDYADNSLAGDLCRAPKFIEPERIAYIGILSSIDKRFTVEDIDYFISLSGPEPQRTIFERKVLQQVETLEGRVVITLGKPEENHYRQYDGVEIFSYLNRSQQERFMNRSHLVISRSGYTTLMEIVELDKSALFVPTPYQTEQTYLSQYHNQMGTFYSIDQDNLDLERDTAIARTYRGFTAPHKTAESVNNFIEVVLS